MNQTILERVEKFLEENEQACLEGSNEVEGEEGTTEQPRRLAKELQDKQSLLRQSYLLMKRLLAHHHLAVNSQSVEIQDQADRLSKREYEYSMQLGQLEVVVKGHEQSLREANIQLLEVGDELQTALEKNSLQQHQLTELKAQNSGLVRKVEVLTTANQQLVTHNNQLQMEHEAMAQSRSIAFEQLKALKEKSDRLLLDLKSEAEYTAMMKLENLQLHEEVEELNSELRAVADRLYRYELGSSGPLINVDDKENIPQLGNLPSECSLTSPRGLTFTKKTLFERESSYEKERLNALHLKDSNQNSEFSDTLVNIEHRLINFCSPTRLESNIAAIPDFGNAHTSPIGDELEEEHALSSIDPYNCFFQLLVQCAKLNSRKFALAAQVDLSGLWQTLLASRIPMNKWSARIQAELQRKLSLLI